MDLVIRNLKLHLEKGHAPGIVELKNILHLQLSLQ